MYNMNLVNIFMMCSQLDPCMRLWLLINKNLVNPFITLIYIELNKEEEVEYESGEHNHDWLTLIKS